jgi:hypothetical protein
MASGYYRQKDVTSAIVYVFLTCVVYIGTFIAFLLLVVKEVKILHGYPRYAELLPGPFVSDRYSWSWYFLIFNFARLFVVVWFVYTLIDVKTRSKRIWFHLLIGYTLFFDVALWIFFIVTSCFLCNNSFFPSESSLCNDELDKWCTVMGDSFPDRCPPSLPTADQCDLKPNPVYIRWIYFHAAFTVLDWISWRFNKDMNLYVLNDPEFYS